MTANVGTVDRLIRAIIGVALIALPFATTLTVGSPALMWGAILVGVVMLAVAITRVCPLYSIFGLKTCA